MESERSFPSRCMIVIQHTLSGPPQSSRSSAPSLKSFQLFLLLPLHCSFSLNAFPLAYPWLNASHSFSFSSTASNHRGQCTQTRWLPTSTPLCKLHTILFCLQDTYYHYLYTMVGLFVCFSFTCLTHGKCKLHEGSLLYFFLCYWVSSLSPFSVLL